MSIIQSEVKTIPIKKINPAVYNPRKDLQPEDEEYRLLEKGMSEFGLVEPLVWNEQTGNLVGGHQRLKILIAEGVSEVRCSVVNLPPGKEKQLNIALNKNTGEWDMPKLKDLLEELDTGADDIEYTGFTEAELEQLMSQVYVPNSDPTISASTVTEDEIAKEKKRLDNAFTGEQDQVELTCPYCKETFFANKEDIIEGGVPRK